MTRHFHRWHWFWLQRYGFWNWTSDDAQWMSDRFGRWIQIFSLVLQHMFQLPPTKIHRYPLLQHELWSVTSSSRTSPLRKKLLDQVIFKNASDGRKYQSIVWFSCNLDFVNTMYFIDFLWGSFVGSSFPVHKQSLSPPEEKQIKILFVMHSFMYQRWPLPCLPGKVSQSHTLWVFAGTEGNAIDACPKTKRCFEYFTTHVLKLFETFYAGCGWMTLLLHHFLQPDNWKSHTNNLCKFSEARWCIDLGQASDE